MAASHTVSSFPHLITREDKASGREIDRVGQIHLPRPRRRWPSGWSGPANHQAKGSRAPSLFSSPRGSRTGHHLQVKRRPPLLRVCFFLLFKMPATRRCSRRARSMRRRGPPPAALAGQGTGMRPRLAT